MANDPAATRHRMLTVADDLSHAEGVRFVGVDRIAGRGGVTRTGRSRGSSCVRIRVTRKPRSRCRGSSWPTRPGVPRTARALRHRPVAEAAPLLLGASPRLTRAGAPRSLASAGWTRSRDRSGDEDGDQREHGDGRGRERRRDGRRDAGLLQPPGVRRDVFLRLLAEPGKVPHEATAAAGGAGSSAARGRPATPPTTTSAGVGSAARRASSVQCPSVVRSVT